MLTQRIRRLIARTLGPLVFLFTLGRVEVDVSGKASTSGRDDGPSIATVSDADGHSSKRGGPPP